MGKPAAERRESGAGFWGYPRPMPWLTSEPRSRMRASVAAGGSIPQCLSPVRYVAQNNFMHLLRPPCGFSPLCSARSSRHQNGIRCLFIPLRIEFPAGQGKGKGFGRTGRVGQGKSERRGDRRKHLAAPRRRLLCSLASADQVHRSHVLAEASSTGHRSQAARLEDLCPHMRPIACCGLQPHAPAIEGARWDQVLVLCLACGPALAGKLC